MFSHSLTILWSMKKYRIIRTMSKRLMFKLRSNTQNSHIDSKKKTKQVHCKYLSNSRILSVVMSDYISLPPDSVKIDAFPYCLELASIIILYLLSSSHRPSPRADKKQYQKGDVSLCSSYQEGWRQRALHPAQVPMSPAVNPPQMKGVCTICPFSILFCEPVVKFKKDSSLTSQHLNFSKYF